MYAQYQKVKTDYDVTQFMLGPAIHSASEI